MGPGPWSFKEPAKAGATMSAAAKINVRIQVLFQAVNGLRQVYQIVAIFQALPKHSYSKQYNGSYFLTKEKIKMSEYKGHWPEFEQQIFPIPPVELAKSFALKIQGFIKESVLLEKENIKLKQSRNQLLAKLI